ncbi:hypothetical protein TRVA0_008S00914 [Trichomonascus vanleenenianus]|uniref:transcriptional regulator SWI6 n=1 Tax=Trichomonascus vanleenenianus TaxID=2268995 RepID=UPI003ECB124B
MAEAPKLVEPSTPVKTERPVLVAASGSPPSRSLAVSAPSAQRFASSSNNGSFATPQHHQQPGEPDSASATPVSKSGVPGILYTATYSGIPVFEMLVNGVAVMRRRQDSCLNATQILKVAGVEKSKRTKVLEREILTGEHEKVQGGYGKYQGTWIPYSRGIDLCRQYGVYETLLPLLEFDPRNQMENTPTKEQALASRKRTLTPMHHYVSQDSFGPPIQPRPLQVSQSATPLASHASQALASFGNPSQVSRGTPVAAVKQDTIRDDSQDSVMPAPAPPIKKKRRVLEDLVEDESLPDTAVPLDPVAPESVDASIAHLVTRLFVKKDDEGNDIDPVALLESMPQLNRMNIDVPIDESGHTALHWASALAMEPLARALVARGAHQQRANYAGETTLVRAVLVTNSFDSAVFPQLLESLYPAIPLVDRQGRTVLHHIALTAGIKGRSGASKYYLECLLEWIVNRGSTGRTGRYGLERFMAEIVNAQDRNGDTALSIAARVGNKNITQQLLDVGADTTIANKVGLTPADFGVVPTAPTVTHPSASVSTRPEVASRAVSSTVNDSASPRAQQQKRREAIETITSLVSGLDGEFEREVEAKQHQIDSMRSQLRDTTQALTERRQRLEELKATANKMVESQRSRQNLDRAIEQEDRQFKEVTRPAEGQPAVSIDYDADFDADQPFRIVTGTAGEFLDLPPVPLLKARIAAYKQNRARLQARATELRNQSAELEDKFRRVVALCTGVEANRVDQLLEGLVQAVQSDRDDMDIDRVAGFLRKIDRAHEGGVVV